MLKTLTEFNAVSGNEDLLAEFIVKNIKPYATDIKIDTMGNIIAFKKGRKGGKLKHMLAAHMDEVGFIITKITENGFLKFEEVGGISDQIRLHSVWKSAKIRLKAFWASRLFTCRARTSAKALLKRKICILILARKIKLMRKNA